MLASAAGLTFPLTCRPANVRSDAAGERRRDAVNTIHELQQVETEVGRLLGTLCTAFGNTVYREGTGLDGTLAPFHAVSFPDVPLYHPACT